MAEIKVDLSRLRVAIIHYWFVGRAGGERVVEAIADLFPQADLFSLVADRSTLAPVLENRKLQTSMLQRIPGATKFHRHLLFLQPLALEQFDLTDYDLVISSESGPAKGVLTSARTCHICYCHSPMRYIWDMYPNYRRGMSGLIGPAFSLAAHYMRIWDYISAGRVDYFLCNSRFVASRIRKTYGRESTVIYPPVCIPELSDFGQPGQHYLTAGRLVDYKRVDLAIDACTHLGRRLRVVGDGPEYRRLRKRSGPTVEFLGAISDSALQDEMRNCRALIFPGEEDFGIVPVEAQSVGRPVIAFASGGALETVRGLFPGEVWSGEHTGVFFEKQSTPSLVKAIGRFEALENMFSAKTIRQHALQFDSLTFKAKIAEFVSSAMKNFNERSLRAEPPAHMHKAHSIGI